jgi:DNA-binding response OmpR family regulator
MLSRLQHLFSRIQDAPSVLAITPSYMDQLALRIASSRKNWDLLICPTFRSGLRTLRKYPVSVILYDLETRDVEWRRGIQLLLAHGRGSCLIALSRKLDDDLWFTALERGVYDLQVKPLKDNVALIESVRAAHALIASHELSRL